eukprot:INCI6956.1.p1 GENE.INCI6956.1~~INCI6956.1.p1  ORF type:complete len:671 (+),score=160.27 INCI6956.1:124-2136(+)
MPAPAILQSVGDARTQRHLERIYNGSHGEALTLWDKVIGQCESLGVKTAQERANFVALLKSCVEYLKRDTTKLQEAYSSDGRLLAVYLRLADHDNDNAYSYFKDMERHGLCQNLAIFHIAKSNVYERNEDIAIAGTILKEAIKRGVEPVKDLKSVYSQYKRRIKSRERKRREREAKAAQEKEKNKTAQETLAAQAARALAQKKSQTLNSRSSSTAPVCAQTKTAPANENYGVPIFTDDAEVASEPKVSAETQQVSEPFVQPTKFNCADFWGAPEEEEEEAEMKKSEQISSENVAAAVPVPQSAQQQQGQNADDSDMTMNAKDALHKIEAALWSDDEAEDEVSNECNQRGPAVIERPLQPFCSRTVARSESTRTESTAGHDENLHQNNATAEDAAVFAIFNESSHDHGQINQQNQALRTHQPLQARSSNTHDIPWEDSVQKPKRHGFGNREPEEQPSHQKHRLQNNHQRRFQQQLEMQSSLQMSAIVPDTPNGGIQIFADDSSIAEDAHAPANEDFSIFTEEQDKEEEKRTTRNIAKRLEKDDAINPRRQTASPSALKQFMFCLDDSEQSDEDNDAPANTRGQRKDQELDNGQSRRAQSTHDHQRFRKPTTNNAFGGNSLGMESSENLLAAIFESREESQSSQESGDMFRETRRGYAHSGHAPFILRSNTM